MKPKTRWMHYRLMFGILIGPLLFQVYHGKYQMLVFHFSWDVSRPWVEFAVWIFQRIRQYKEIRYEWKFEAIMPTKKEWHTLDVQTKEKSINVVVSWTKQEKK